MTSESFDQQVERLFNEALDLPAQAREAFVRSAAPGPVVAQEVLALLRADAAETIDPLREPVLECSLAGLATPDSAEPLQRQAGSWTLHEQLFADETGAVFRGRDLKDLDRCVKVYRNPAGPDARRSQRRERALAEALDHSGVPRLLDFSGRAEAPYLVFDCEPGVPLLRFCDQARVPIPGRLELFTRFADALAHAHERGVIHGSPTPAKFRCEERAGGVRFLVLGFGAALSRQPAALSADTAPYLAPEHCVGVTARDTLGDVFALGAILYELLVGVTPFDPGALLRRTAEAAPAASWAAAPPPSRRLAQLAAPAAPAADTRWIDTADLARFLRDRMDPIVMRAIQVQAGQRYPTVPSLVDDIRAVLSDLWPDEQSLGISDRAARWMRRLFSP